VKRCRRAPVDIRAHGDYRLLEQRIIPEAVDGIVNKKFVEEKKSTFFNSEATAFRGGKGFVKHSGVEESRCLSPGNGFISEDGVVSLVSVVPW
jgi:hypothetical protein